MICPICGKEVKRMYGHLNFFKLDLKHKMLFEREINLVIELFNNDKFSKHSDPKDFGSLLNYDNCLNIWREHFSEEERKERSKKLNALNVSKALKGKPFSQEHKEALAKNRNKIPWNKGLTVDSDERIRKLRNKVNNSMSKLLKVKYEKGEMTAWMKGKTKETDHRIAEYSNKVSRTMASKDQNNSRAISGIRKDIGHHAASTYEANIYRIFQYHNVSYLYEFDNIKEIIHLNGEVRNYRIDMLDVDGVFGVPGAYLEVKGFYKQEDRLKVKLFREQYPNETLLLVGYGDKRVKYAWAPDVNYADLEKKYKPLIPLWEDKKQNLRKNPELYAMEEQ